MSTCLSKTTFIPTLLLFSVAFALPSFAQEEDEEGCKDHPLFNRLPGFHIAECRKSQFDLKRFPIGPPSEQGGEAKSQAVEGAFFFVSYTLNEGATKPSSLQIMRNFLNAARNSGANVVAQYPGWCNATLHETMHTGNSCIGDGLTLKFGGQGKETWSFIETDGAGESYDISILERETMKQDIAINQLRERLDKDGFIALYINFETGSAVIRQDSMPQLEEVAQLLKTDAALKLEVGGHTDNVGTPESNQKLSEERAKSVVAAITKQGIAAERLIAKGYGQSTPIADNRSEEGRAKNRRVELVKK